MSTRDYTNILDAGKKAGFALEAQLALVRVAQRLDEATRTYLTAVYSDPQILHLYDEYRMQNEQRFRASASKRLFEKPVSSFTPSLKFPSNTVYRFLDDIFTPVYGPEWLTDTPTLRKVIKNEPLIKPWVLLEI